MHIPTSLVTIRPNDKPWYNSEIRKTSRKRDREKQTAIRTKHMSDWNKYKHLRNKVNNINKHAKETFLITLEFTLSDISIQNPRQYWKIVKALMKENSSTCEPIPPSIK